MPYAIECYAEHADLTESRTLITWKAAISLSTEVYPEGAQFFTLLEKPHVAVPREVLAWRVALNRIRIMPKRELPFDIKQFEDDWFVDYEAIAKKLNTSVEHVSLMIRAADKSLMSTVVEEIANAVLHSNQLKHEIALSLRKRFDD
ncbi:hypothetical protein B9Q11_02545 [Candidatus Marsarchaeota G2 archaeon ECH_B_SAG-F08]|jgi:hypothetical protein|uniref:Uncharacterized protein n=5 Tax=Candidatus Marsarchaeota TaxID=1978152 RepID=A0A2R6AG47_9ARCH|nr:MAG: hypothetical protein B9Q01_02870 [Candidatus Marsarchaeota G1 archaeon OSP_D]PSN85345.1 MAG: hypothetical protein B9Q02_06740 [Candidatus Marsarchaeota G1 archaeon BE_D]PSN88412.1 MAG: hypothetical protein B9Q00_05570 [Candidatus Marsarchaeota G1 archaeon OSP_C]PSN96511.1 MAG: hypothetical protein B9P99_00275 [Candidatus Marsarchaeota G1 archaeon OSP_B]PSN98280.1 MAG: hypothetical protein B9Q11_02545 [Candidatus Marsarchaeota G2 archaeon ECH_B_SAG-F08]